MRETAYERTIREDRPAHPGITDAEWRMMEAETSTQFRRVLRKWVCWAYDKGARNAE